TAHVAAELPGAARAEDAEAERPVRRERAAHLHGRSAAPLEVVEEVVRRIEQRLLRRRDDEARAQAAAAAVDREVVALVTERDGEVGEGEPERALRAHVDEEEGVLDERDGTEGAQL